VDAGAVAALLSGKSLLAAGVRAVEGHFSRGETVAIIGESGREVARGLVAYDAQDAVKIMGLKSAEIAEALGYETRGAMVHRDDLVLSAGAKLARKEKAEG
jgi:glutamate 5-kinase